MRNQFGKIIIHLFVFLVAITYPCLALEVHTQYATIIYNENLDLERFNAEIYLGKYDFLLQQDGVQSVADEIKLKIDFIVARVKEILDIFPNDVKFKIVICESGQELRNMYARLYGKPTDFSAFYANDIDIVFFSPEDVELATIAHEFAHVIMQKQFQASPPVKIHELLSRYVAKHIKD